MSVEYSKGFQARVYQVDQSHHLGFPHADLYRIESTRDRTYFVRLFLKHKIASLLFPNNFITVVGSQSDRPTTDLQTEQIALPNIMSGQRFLERGISLFSCLASVPKDHSVFAAHFKLSDKVSRGKSSSCRCEVCVRHNRFHKSTEIYRIANQLGSRAARIGIYLPDEDSSDFCLINGEVIFFEIESINPHMIWKYLINITNPTDNEQSALRLLDRYEILESQARKDSNKGLAEFRN